jgi:hypothetical protein
MLHSSSDPCVVGPVTVGSCYSTKMRRTLNVILRGHVLTSVQHCVLRKKEKVSVFEPQNVTDDLKN